MHRVPFSSLTLLVGQQKYSTSGQKILTKGRIACRAVVVHWMTSFAAHTTAQTRNAFQWARQPAKIAFLPRGGSRPHLIHGYLFHNLISVQRPRSTWSSCLKITDRPFHYASPCFWNQLSLSTSFWYQFLHFQLTYSFTHHFFFFPLLIHHSAHP